MMEERAHRPTPEELADLFREEESDELVADDDAAARRTARR